MNIYVKLIMKKIHDRITYMIEFVIEKLVEYPVLNIINHNISSLGNPYFSTGKIY